AAYAALDARAAELVAEASTRSRPENLASRVMASSVEAANRRDWDALRALYYDTGYEWIDCRRGLRSRLIGAEAMESLRFLMALDDLRWVETALATRGDHLVL